MTWLKLRLWLVIGGFLGLVLTYAAHLSFSALAESANMPAWVKVCIFFATVAFVVLYGLRNHDKWFCLSGESHRQKG